MGAFHAWYSEDIIQQPVGVEGLLARQVDIAGYGLMLVQILLEGRTKVICFEAAQEDTIKVGSRPLCPSIGYGSSHPCCKQMQACSTIDEAAYRNAHLSCGKLHKPNIFRRRRCLQINRNAQTQRIPLGEAEMNTMEHTLCEGALAAAAAVAQKEKTPRSA